MIEVAGTADMPPSANARPKIFLCHANVDAAKAELLFHILTAAGATPWLDKTELVLGDEWELEIKAAVAAADAFVVCLRPGFDEIGFRQREVRWAIEALQVRPPGTGFIVPFIVEPCGLPHWCNHLHAGSDLTKPSDATDLIRALSKHTGIKLKVPSDVGRKELPSVPARLPRDLPNLLDLKREWDRSIHELESAILETASNADLDELDHMRERGWAIDRRIRALRASPEVNSPEVGRLQQEMLASYPGDREKAARQLGEMGRAAEGSVASLTRGLRDPSIYVRSAAAWALGEIGTEDAIAALVAFHFG